MTDPSREKQNIVRWLGAKGYPNYELHRHDDGSWQVTILDREGKLLYELGGSPITIDELKREIGSLPQGQP